MKTYIGFHFSFENLTVENPSLLFIQHCIKRRMGKENKDYETASISEYNSIKRLTAYYYYSVAKGCIWVRVPYSITDYASWNSAKNPYKAIARWLLKLFGFEKKQEKRITLLFREAKKHGHNG